jgi:hypothetical protein
MVEIKFDAFLSFFGRWVVEILHERNEWRDVVEWYPEEGYLKQWARIPKRNSIPFETTPQMTLNRMCVPVGSKHVKNGWSVHCMSSNSREEIDYFLAMVLPWLIDRPVEIRVWPTSWDTPVYVTVRPQR